QRRGEATRLESRQRPIGEIGKTVVEGDYCRSVGQHPGLAKTEEFADGDSRSTALRDERELTTERLRRHRERAHEARGLLGDRVIGEDWHEPHSALRSDGIQTRRLPALVRYDFVGARRQEAPRPAEDKGDALATPCRAAI